MANILSKEKRLQIGRRIRTERRKAGLTGEQLAEKLTDLLGHDTPISQGTISAWENGKSFPRRIETLFALAQVFRCDTGYLLCDYDSPVHDMETIADALGLSYDAVQNLRYVMKSVAAFGVPVQPYRQCADFLIASDYLRKLAVSMGDYETAYSKALERRRDMEKERKQARKNGNEVVFIRDKTKPHYDDKYKSARNDMIELVFEITRCIEDAVQHPDE